MNEIVIYQSQDGTVDVRLEQETVWLTLMQMTELFGRDKSVISRHIRNVFAGDELDRLTTVANFATVQQDSGRSIVRDLEHFNLDVVISVGYRVKSPEGVRFRHWASRILRDYLTRGYAIDRQRLETNARELEAALELVKRTHASPELGDRTGEALADILIRYTQTFLWLQRYDEGLLTDPKGHLGGVLPTQKEARIAAAPLKIDLMAKGQASALFGNERDDGLAAVLGNLDQSVLGERVLACLPVWENNPEWQARRALGLSEEQPE